MEKKESYRRTLPHFQQPGQAYFVTWNLKDAVPSKALLRYTQRLAELNAQIEFHKDQKSEKRIIDEIRTNYYSTRRKYIKAYEEKLDLGNNLTIDLCKAENLEIIKKALHFWEGLRLTNYAYSIMPNHVHWAFKVFENDENGQPVYLQKIMQSVKRETANMINKLENRTGSLWQHESFDITIRDDKHLYHAINYTLQNPVTAGLVSIWKDWPGCWCADGCADF